MANIITKSLFNNPVKVIEELSSESIEDSEKALGIYVEKMGDNALAEVLTDLHPLSLARIISGHDFSKPTLAHWLIPKEKFIDIFKHLPLLWYEQIDSDGNLMKLEKINEVRLKSIDIFLTIFSSLNENEERKEFIEIIMSDDASFEYMLLPFVGDFLSSKYLHSPEKSRISESDDYDINLIYKDGYTLHSLTEGTPEHLFLLIKEYSHEAASKIFEALISDFKSSSKNDSVAGLIQRLYVNAKSMHKPKDDDIYELL